MSEAQTGPDEAPLSTILRRVTDAEDLDTCQMLANVTNAYIDFIRRASGRIELHADDLMRILTIQRIMLGALETEQSFAKLAGRRKLKPEVVT